MKRNAYDNDELVPTMDIPVLVLKESIANQFSDPTFSRKDFLSKILESIKSDKDEFQYDEEETQALNKIHSDLMVDLLELFQSYLGIGVNNIGELSDDDQDEIMITLYTYFILNMKKNFVQLVMYFIKNKTSEVLTISELKKDITTLSYKSEIEDPDTLRLLANICGIIEYCINSVTTIDQFLEYTAHPDRPESSDINRYYDDFTLTGNFIRNYSDMITPDLMSEIEIKIREKILKMYRNSRKDVE